MSTGRRLLAGLLTMIGLASTAAAADGPKPASPPDPAFAARLAGIKAEYDAARDACSAAVAKIADQKEYWATYSRMDPDVVAYSRRMLELAREKPADPAARDACLWVIDQPNRIDYREYGDAFAEAGALLARHHGDDPVAVAAGLGLDRALTAHREALLFGFYAAAKGRESRGIARLALARYLEKKSIFIPPIGRLPDRRQNTIHGVLGDDGKVSDRKVDQSDEQYAYILERAGNDPASVRGMADRLYEEVIAEYADVPYITMNDRATAARLREPTPTWNGSPVSAEEIAKLRQRLEHPTTLGRVARGYLDEMRNVAPGKPAPEIRGADLDGTPRALSDYRGKVVVLVFWGSWCGPCMREVPHERELAEKYKDRPFALLGVDCNEDRAAGLKAAQAERMTWPSWNDGADGDGPIVRAYHVQAYPTVFVIDAQGVIRAKQVLGDGIDKAVDGLLAGMK